jgi:hypothetical protein
MRSTYSGIGEALQRSGVSLRKVTIWTIVLIALALAVRVLYGCLRLFFRYIVGVRV